MVTQHVATHMLSQYMKNARSEQRVLASGGNKHVTTFLRKADCGNTSVKVSSESAMCGNTCVLSRGNKSAVVLRETLHVATHMIDSSVAVTG